MTPDRFSGIHADAERLLYGVARTGQPVWRPRRGKVAKDAADLSRGVEVVDAMPDPEGLLISAMHELRRFLAAAGLAPRAGGAPYRLRFEEVPDERPEYFLIQPGPMECVVRAGSLEGARRAVYRMEEILQAEPTAALPWQPVESHAAVKLRIGRCFCGPINRPPLYHDELSDEFDYYPDDFLNELARSGINRVWISSDFKKLSAANSIRPGDGRAKERLEKLRRIVGKCRRYGIGVYIFCIEAIAFDPDDPVLQTYPELAGPQAASGKIAFCSGSETAQRYLHDFGRSLMQAAPGLAGLLDLSVGEWLTVCSNVLSWPKAPCPRCGQGPRHAALNRELECLLAGMQSVDPAAEMVSWPYSIAGWWGAEAALEASHHPARGVKVVHNFESYGEAVQLGKKRPVTDYWLSYPGPSQVFRDYAVNIRRAGGEILAKLQVACSTEIATTQFLPVPALLYRKMAAARELGVSGIMLGWYFGSYPSLMTRAVLRLGQEPFPAGEAAFLQELAASGWGRERSRAVARAWRLFSDAFAEYPLFNTIAYIGPMHDAVVWKLHLKPVDQRLTPSWNHLLDPPGDRIFECLTHGADHDNIYTLKEAITQVGRMTRQWERARKLLVSLATGALTPGQRLELDTAEAVGLIFADALDVFRFYDLRQRLIFGKASRRLLRQMRSIVERARLRSAAMLPLLRRHPQLGYHSEATGYKITPRLLRARIRHLQRLLETDLPAAEAAVERREALFPEYSGLCPRGPVCHVGDGVPGKPVRLRHFGRRFTEYAGAYPSDRFVPEKPQGRQVAPAATFSAATDAEALTIFLHADQARSKDRFVLSWETARGHRPEVMTIAHSGEVAWPLRRCRPAVNVQTLPDGSWNATVRFAYVDFGLPGPARTRLNVERSFMENGVGYSSYWMPPRFLPWVYTLGTANPQAHGWLMPSRTM